MLIRYLGRYTQIADKQEKKRPANVPAATLFGTSELSRFAPEKPSGPALPQVVPPGVPIRVAVSILTPGPMVEEIATRLT